MMYKELNMRCFENKFGFILMFLACMDHLNMIRLLRFELPSKSAHKWPDLQNLMPLFFVFSLTEKWLKEHFYQPFEGGILSEMPCTSISGVKMLLNHPTTERRLRTPYLAASPTR